jgi:3',5'-cyclic-AMP phosphodiesterase
MMKFPTVRLIPRRKAALRKAALCLALVVIAMFPAPVRVANAQTPPSAPKVRKPAPFTFVVFGDNRPAQEGDPVTDVFKQIIGEIRALHPAFVVTTGDLIYGSKTGDAAVLKRQYDDVEPLVRSLKVPVYFAAGNHEVRGLESNEAVYRKRISDRLYYSFDYGDSHFVVLDSDIVGQEHRVIGAQRDWLEADLKRVQGKARHIFVFQHEQPYPVSLHIGTSLDAFPADRDAFQALLKKYHVEALITGHEHLYDDSIHGGVLEIIAGGAGAPLYPSARGGSFYHYLVITVDGDQTFINVVKPGSVFPATDVLKLAPSEKKEPQTDH